MMMPHNPRVIVARQRCQQRRGTFSRILYGPERSLPAVVSALYKKLDELRKLCGYESIEEILDGIIDRQRRLNRMAELQGKVVLSVRELREFQVLREQFRQYVKDLSMQKKRDHGSCP
jgi:hypothetical protein